MELIYECGYFTRAYGKILQRVQKKCSSKHYHGSGVPLYFLPALSNIIPVGIVDDANHFEWRKPDGTTWKIENVADLEVFTYHEEYSQSESALVGWTIDDYHDKYFDDTLFVFKLIIPNLNQNKIAIYKGSKCIYELPDSVGFPHYEDDVYDRIYTGLYFDCVKVMPPDFDSHKRSIPRYEYHKFTVSEGKDEIIGTGRQPTFYSKFFNKSPKAKATPKSPEEIQAEQERYEAEKLQKIYSLNSQLRNGAIPDYNGLYPDDIAVLYMVKKEVQFITPRKYNCPISPLTIPNPKEILQSLLNKGMISLGPEGSGLDYADFRQIQAAYSNLKIGKIRNKAGQIEGIKSTLTPSEIDVLFPSKPYVITSLGESALSDHLGIVFALDRELHYHEIETAFSNTIPSNKKDRGFYFFDSEDPSLLKFNIWTIEAGT